MLDTSTPPNIDYHPSLPLVDVESLAIELSQGQVIKTIQSHLQPLREKLHQQFLNDLNSRDLVPHYATQMDALLSCIWEFKSLNQQGLSLVAVGGYGRAELHPHSDIDLLILAEDDDAINNNSGLLQDFITLLWDIKLDVGHSVRTIDECVNEARSDLTIITNLMESRYLCGDTSPLTALKEQIQPEHIWQNSQFFHAKWEELTTRHNKHNSPEYNFEPNVKNSPGTLRDIHTICWIALRQFGDNSLQNLVTESFLTEEEYDSLNYSLTFLWQVRSALHILSGREEDRLLFNLQKQVAETLGYQEGDDKPAVERFMSDFYRHQLSTTELTDILLQRFNEHYMVCGPNSSVALNEHFELQNGYLLLLTPDLFIREPAWLLKVFVLMAQSEQALGMHSNTIRAIRDARNLVDDAFRKNPEHNRLFLTLLRCENRVTQEISRMMRYGILGSYIPEFGEIIGMMEHDLLHKYTVDDHSLRMVRLLRGFRDGEASEAFPLSIKLINKVQKKELLYLAALLHDVGKCQPGDHAANSQVIAAAFCQQHQLSQADSDMVSWLCGNHLLMSNAAQRLDLGNPDDIHQFALEVGDREHLRMLFLISVADTYSTNPDLWTPWRAEQMRTLYKNANQALRAGLENRRHKEDAIKETQQSALEQLARYGMSEERVREIWGQPGDDYFLRETAENIVWQTLEIDAHGNKKEPLVSISLTSNREFEGASQIFVFTQDHPNLFAITTITLDQLNLNIQDARIMVSENERNAVNTFVVLDDQNQPLTDQDQINHIRQTLRDALSQSDNYETVIQRRTPRLLKEFMVPTQVAISNDPYLMRTVIEVTAADRPGLLARMGEVFIRHKAQLLSAKILTEGERVSDIFFIQNEYGNPFAKAESCQQLEQDIIAALDNQVEAQTAV